MNALAASLFTLWQKSPARIVAFTIAALDLAVSFGLNISTDQQSKIVAFVGALIVLLGGELVRSQVTSPATIERTRAADDIDRMQAKLDATHDAVPGLFITGAPLSTSTDITVGNPTK